MDWQPAPDALIDLIEDDLEQQVSSAHYARLPFYEDGYLVHAMTRDSVVRLVFGGALGGVAVCQLDGRSTQIRMANRICGLRLTRETVGDYARFFCGNLTTGDGGSFEFVEHRQGRHLDSGHKLRDMRLRVGGQDHSGSFRVGGYQLIDDVVVRVSLSVCPNGKVNMLRDLPLGSLVSVN